ncbi:MAG: hypothetical protein JNJ73_21480 [Hyphomonadaceae bacterium]|nr:hypothetical protein [Hyphomonadaceae bacterium]
MGGDIRKLATIVAVDAVGFSRQSERDETLAIREISALRQRVSDGAATHGGRVFNTAGDGFMLEFPSASGALAFSEALLAETRIPLRIGLHLGEVHEAPGGDLLGRGVNVAARLRELADPGEFRLSREVVRALPAPGGVRFTSRGTIKLDKMDERVEMFALAAPWGGKALRWPKRAALWAAGLVIVALVGVAALAPALLRQSRAERVAVLEFSTPGDASLQPFADGLAGQIVSVMSVNNLQAIANADRQAFRGPEMKAAARRIGAAFVLDGSVRRDREDLLVSMHVIDARVNVTLWSNEYRRAAAESTSLQEQVAAHVADVLRCALVSRRPSEGEIDAQTLSIFLRACDRVQRFDRGPDEMYEAARQVTERAPAFSRGWSMLAMASALASRNIPPDRAAPLREEARAAAERARRLDSRNAETDLALSLLLPWDDRKGRQELISRALANDPTSAEANYFQGSLLAELGRMSDALGFMRRAIALDPLSPSYWSGVVPVLSATGNMSEAVELRERLSRVWPNSPSAWFNRFNNAALNEAPEQALALLDSPGAPVRMETPMRDAWRRYLLARNSGQRAQLRAAVENIASLARAGQFDMPRAISAASRVDERDIAFALADAFFERLRSPVAQPVFGASHFFLFLGPGRAMMHDVRFMALAKKIGLVDYWSETGEWPDFCVDPLLPYNCQAEAARAN